MVPTKLCMHFAALSMVIFNANLLVLFITGYFYGQAEEE